MLALKLLICCSLYFGLDVRAASYKIYNNYNVLSNPTEFTNKGSMIISLLIWAGMNGNRKDFIKIEMSIIICDDWSICFPNLVGPK